MSDDDSAKRLIRVLDDIADTAEQTATEHVEECPAHDFSKDVSRIARRTAGALRSTSGGPAQVATSQYRANWDTIFGRPTVVGQA